MPSTNSAPCPSCKASNFEYRRECWKCKRTLPVSFGIDARRIAAANAQRNSGPLGPLPDHIAKQLNKPPEPQKPVEKVKRIGLALIKPVVKSS